MMRFAIIFFLLLACAAAAPTITNAPGTVSDGQSITISGSGFGQGPNVILFDNFDDGGAIDADVDFNSPVGGWSGTGTYGGFEYSSNHISGSRSARAGCDGNDIMRMIKDFSPVQEFFLSWWIIWPEGYKWADARDINCLPVARYCADLSTAESKSQTTMPVCCTQLEGTMSNHKMAWVLDRRKSGTDDDMITPMFRAYNMQFGSGNDIGPHDNDLYMFDYKDQNRDWLNYGTWMRMSFYARADPDDEDGDGMPDLNAENGYLWAQALNEDPAQPVNHWSQQRWGNAQFIDVIKTSGDADPPEEWNRLSVTGYIDKCNPQTRFDFDDMYLATGPNAFARVEIGNAPVYKECRKLFLSLPDSWSSNSIRLKAMVGNFKQGDKAYLYVIHSDGAISNAYPIAIGSGGTCIQSCAGKECGPDNCGGSCPPGCSGTETCVSGQCAADCVPSCAGKQCGGDGCGGSCGTCTEGDCIDYKCVAETFPFETWGDVPGAEHPGTIRDTFLNINTNNYEGQDISVWQYQLNPPKLPANTIIISADLSAIGSSTVQSARLKIYMKEKYGEDALTTSIHELNKEPVMTEATGYKASGTVDWTAVPAGTTSNGAPLGLADIGSAADTVTLGTAYGIVSYDITSIVQDCVAENIRCNFLIRGYETQAETGRTFASNEDPEPSLRPRIEISFSHAADTDHDGQISIGELAAYMNAWKTSQGPTIADMMSAIKLWKN